MSWRASSVKRPTSLPRGLESRSRPIKVRDHLGWEAQHTLRRRSRISRLRSMLASRRRLNSASRCRASMWASIACARWRAGSQIRLRRIFYCVGSAVCMANTPTRSLENRNGTSDTARSTTVRLATSQSLRRRPRPHHAIEAADLHGPIRLRQSGGDDYRRCQSVDRTR